MTKLLLAVYEVENAALALARSGGGGGRADGWEMNGMVLDVSFSSLMVMPRRPREKHKADISAKQGALYLEDSSPPSKLASKAASEFSNRLQSYYGYSFEAFCTMPSSPSSASSAPPPSISAFPAEAEDGFTPPNTNIQFCSLVKTSLGPHRTILGGEVDCLSPRPGLEEGNPAGVEVKTSDFVELKTNIVIQGERDVRGFERWVCPTLGERRVGR